MIDLITPFALIGTAAATLVALEARGRILVVAGVAAILYVEGHGIHLSANSIANEGPGPEVDDLVHFWDETFSHIVAVSGWFGLVACFCWAEGDRGGRGVDDPSRVRLIAATALFLGWSFFTGTVEGGTWPIELATTAAFSLWLLQARRGRGLRAVAAERPLLTASWASFALSAVLIGIWAIAQGGVPQFSETGLL